MANLTITSQSFSFADKSCGGWRNIAFSLNGEICKNGTVSGDTLKFQRDGIQQKVSFDQHENTLVVTRTLINTTKAPLRITEVSDGIMTADASVGVVGQHEYNLAFLHTDNARTERFPDSRPEYPYLRQIPYQPVELGRGEANAFPAVVICDLHGDNLLVEGDLDQSENLRYWSLGVHGIGDHTWKDPLRTYRGHQIRPLANEWTVAPGETVTLSTVFYQLLAGVEPWEAWNAPGGYVAELERRHEFAVRTSPMLHGAVYCTWNYGTLTNIDENLLAKRARVLADNVPGCTHFLIDDGYQRGSARYLDTFYPDPAGGFNPERFPAGMKAMADTFRAAGLVPCIWFAPSIRLDSRLAHDNPEWLLRDSEGNAGLLGDTTFLDVSHPEAMAFLLAIFDVLFVEMSLSFDSSQNCFSITVEQSRIGWAGLKPGIELRDEGRQSARFKDVRETLDGGQIAEAEYECGLRETLTFEPYGDNAFILRRSLANSTQKSVSLRYASISKSDGAKESGPLFDAPVLHHARFAHPDNLRTEEIPKCRAEYPFLRPLPWQTAEFGNQKSQPAPYMILPRTYNKTCCLKDSLTSPAPAAPGIWARTKTARPSVSTV